MYFHSTPVITYIDSEIYVAIIYQIVETPIYRPEWDIIMQITCSCILTFVQAIISCVVGYSIICRNTIQCSLSLCRSAIVFVSDSIVLHDMGYVFATHLHVYNIFVINQYHLFGSLQ